MKKGYIFGVVGLIAVVVIAAIVLGGKSNTSTTTTTDTKSSSSKSSGFKANVKSACDILTQSVADNLLGPDSTSNSSSPEDSVGDTETSDVKVTNCTYTSSDHKMTLGLLVRAAKDQTQADTDATQFTDTTNVPGYGDKAYWATSYGQFNILAHNNWYILSYGSLTPSARTQADGQKFADAIKDQL